MADVAPKVKKAAKPKKPSNHPKYSEMIKAAITSLKERGGSSRQAILRYIMAHYNVGKDEKVVNTHLKLSLKSGVKKGTLKQSKGTGASGSFRLGAVEKAKKVKKSPKVKKPKAAKPKKAKSPAKKAAKKSPAKKATKKSPAKKAAKKPATKRPATKKPKSPKKKAPAKKVKKSPKKAAKK
ncbi:late histone H1-like [Liolophura sinensis]|uniref:late histone H1-like n=1 Tax=Liolophura sinensis TaxID=3198878 RepID=UPI00315855EE